MATEPFLPPGTVVLTDSWPSAKPTLVFSATLTSDWLVSSIGWTSTVVSVRSLAVTRTWAPATSMVAVMGPGVANAGMASSLSLCFAGDLVRWAANLGPVGQARFLKVDSAHRYPA